MDTMSKFGLTERDVDQKLDIEGVELSDGSLVSPIYLLRLAKQSGIIQAQVTKVLSMLESSQDKVETVAKCLYEQDYSLGYWDTRMSKGDKSKWIVKVREICRLFHTLPNLEKELKSE